VAARFDLAGQAQTLDRIMTQFHANSHHTHPNLLKHHWAQERPPTVANFSPAPGQDARMRLCPQRKQPLRVRMRTPGTDAAPSAALHVGSPLKCERRPRDASSGSRWRAIAATQRWWAGKCARALSDAKRVIVATSAVRPNARLAARLRPHPPAPAISGASVIRRWACYFESVRCDV